jgi:hypothetical protein
MTNERILEMWNLVNHNKSVTEQLIDFALLIERYVHKQIQLELAHIIKEVECTTPHD